MISLILVLLASVPAMAEPEVETQEDFTLEESVLRWSGYFENQVSFMALPQRDPNAEGSGVDLMDYNKLRVELSARPSPGFSAHANLVVRTWHGSTTYHLDELLPERFGTDVALLSAMDPAMAELQLEDEIFLNDAYLTATHGLLRVRLGKQQIRFGSGYMWNPTDPFTVIDPLDPSYEKPGVTAARVQLHLPHEVLLEAYALPLPALAKFEVEDTAVALRARVALGQWVLAGTYASLYDLAGVNLFAADPMIYGRRHLGGVELTGEIAGIGLWAEGAYNRVTLDSWNNLNKIAQEEWIEVMGGASYTFRGGVMVMVEGLYNERGAAESSEYTLWQWLAYLDQTVRYLGQGYGAGTIQVPLGRLHTLLSLTAMANISDGSMLISPWVSYDWSQSLSVSAYGALTAGPGDGELSSFGHAGYLRLRLSF